MNCSDTSSSSDDNNTYCTSSLQQNIYSENNYVINKKLKEEIYSSYSNPDIDENGLNLKYSFQSNLPTTPNKNRILSYKSTTTTTTTNNNSSSNDYDNHNLPTNTPSPTNSTSTEMSSLVSMSPVVTAVTKETVNDDLLSELVSTLIGLRK